MATLAAAWTPPESKNISTVYPSKKLVKINYNRLLMTGYNNTKTTYTKGFISPIKFILLQTRT